MSLITLWHGEVELPALPRRRVKVGENAVEQSPFPGAVVRAEVKASEVRGHDLLETPLLPPFDRMLIRRKGARRVAGGLPVLSAGYDLPEHFPERVVLGWDDGDQLAGYAATPEAVLALWNGIFRFSTENEAEGVTGLRPPQIGALHAIAAHFAVGARFEPATVVLPTGTGKTETMLAAQVYRRPPRTLVLVPSVPLRSQIAGKFASLGVLPDLGIVPFEIARPRIAALTGGVRTVEDAHALLREANVIVALPNTLEACDPEAREALISGCTDLMVDEAHHVSAATWAAVRDRFADKRVVQFTATPFRRDSKRIDGRIIFNFKLGDAQTAGYYRPINLVAVEEYGEQERRDRVVAEAALEALRRDRSTLGLDHLLMARTRTKERAVELLAIYSALAPELKPVLVYSGPGRTLANREALAQLLDRGPDGARIVICVDMLGEGFDLSNLKVAALHDTHKSLAVTLQFIGRFTRKGNPGRIGEATVVTNVADPEAERRLAELYAQGADWDRIIRRLSEERIDEELRLQDVVDQLRRSGDLHAQLSLWNLRPALSTQFFRTKCEAWNPLAYASVLPNGAEHWHAYDDAGEVLVAVLRRSNQVSWGNYQDVVDVIHDLLVMRWDREQGVLALYASDYSGLRSEMMAVAVTGEDTQLVTGKPIFQILNNVELPLVKSLGSSRIGAISFTSYFGPNVTEGLASIEKAESSLNNIACLGYENGERVLWGGTQRRGKIWQQKGGSIADWLDWTRYTWAKVTASPDQETNITRDFLRPERISAPWPSPPIALQWGEQAQMGLNDRQSVGFDGALIPVFLVDLDIAGTDADGGILLRIASGTLVSIYRLLIAEALPGGYRHEHVSGPRLTFQKARNPEIAIEEYLAKDPFLVRYVDGTYSYNCYHIPIALDAGAFSRDRLEHWDWDGIPLNQESMHKTVEKASIQYRTFAQLAGEYDLVFNDDGSGEAADLVCFKDIDDTTIGLCLVHCKGAHGGHVSRDIRNFYTVCGQAQKSVAVKHSGINNLYHDLKRRHDIWAREGATRFLKGDVKRLVYFKDKARRAGVKFEMILVQPGASIATVTDDALKLLGTTELYLKKTTQADLRVILSA